MELKKFNVALKFTAIDEIKYPNHPNLWQEDVNQFCVRDP